MNVTTMRRFDRLVATPTCALLTLLRRIRDLGPPRRKASPPRVLLIKLAEQGSTVLAASAIRRAVERFGREQVYFLCFEENRFILDAMELIPPGNVLVLRTEGLLSTLGGAVSLMRRLRSLGFDVAVDMEFFARSTAILAYLSGAPRRVGFHAVGPEGPWRGDLLTHRLHHNPHLHAEEVFRLLIEAIDADPRLLPTVPFVLPAAPEPPPALRVSAEERQAVRSLLAAAFGAGALETRRRLVLLNANCSDIVPLRAWPAERYEAVARALLAEDEEVLIAFTGAPVEAAPAQRLADAVGSSRCVSLAGRTTLRQLLVLFGEADVLVTNDSGPAHFAGLTDIDVITLFGPETPLVFGSRSPRSHILHAGLACSPCVSALNNRESRCRDNLCMKAIGVEEVLALVRRLLARRRGDGPVGVPLPVVAERTAPVRSTIGGAT